MEEWISLSEYAKRFKMHVNNVKHLIHTGELKAVRTEGGHYKIRVGGDTVSREMYEKEKEERIRLQTILDNIGLMIKERS
jgi:excisionase family DNA binding protein